MPSGPRKIRDRAKDALEGRTLEDVYKAMAPDLSPPPPRIRNAAAITPAAVERRWGILKQQTSATEADREHLYDDHDVDRMTAYERNIENFIGTVKVPLAVVGPLRVNGEYAQGDYYLPMATTEAAMVASYHRGAQLLTDAGGCSALLLSEGVTRSPCFTFATLAQTGAFALWASSQVQQFQEVASSTTRHGRLLDVRASVEGNHCYLNFDFSTGDAAGQNMVTIATQAVCTHIAEHAPEKPLHMAVEGNLSGDKKATFASFMGVRGKKVSAEALIPAWLVEKHLHVTVEALVNQWQLALIGSVMSGAIGAQCHYANGLAALFIATGQDAACVSEAAVGITRFEKTTTGDLYASVTLPNLIVGAVGGGTDLPSQAACMRIARAPNARAFAELCAGLCLAGELSLGGAICAGDFARAHQKQARGRTPTA